MAQKSGIPQPNSRSLATRTDVPPRGTWIVKATEEEAEGKQYHLHGNAVVEGTEVEVRADDIQFNEDTGDLKAEGHVYYRNFPRN